MQNSVVHFAIAIKRKHTGTRKKQRQKKTYTNKKNKKFKCTEVTILKMFENGAKVCVCDSWKYS